MNFYVYLLINTKPKDKRKFYIGSRGTKKEIFKDNYFSSSNVIKKIIKEEGNYFEKIILQTFDTREEAYEFEKELQIKMDIPKNPLFYNQSIQLSSGYTTAGVLFINGEKITTDEYKQNENLIFHSKNKITVVDNKGNTLQIDKNDPLYLKGELVAFSKGKVPLLNKHTQSVTKEEYYKNKHKYIATNLNKVPVKDKFGNTFLVHKNDERIKNGELCHVSKGLVSAKTENGVTVCITKEEFDKGGYYGVNKGNISLEKNPNAKKINIYNSKSELIFETFGNFKNICEKNNLPFNALAKSYRNKGEKIYSKRCPKEYEKFIGYYAKEV